MPADRAGDGLGVLTLNIARPNADHAKALLGYLWGRPEPLLVLTEAGSGSGSALIAAVFREAGDTVLSSVRGTGELGVMLIARGCPVDVGRGGAPGSMPYRLQSARLGGLHIAGTYGQASDPVRYASAAQRQRKREWLAAYADWLAAWSDDLGDEPHLLVGDLNIVDPEFDDRLPYVLAEEMAVYRWMTTDLGLTDAFRAHNPPQSSWFDHSGAGCRYDHAFTSDSVTVIDSELDQFPREAGLTDHAALSVQLRW